MQKIFEVKHEQAKDELQEFKASMETEDTRMFDEIAKLSDFIMQTNKANQERMDALESHHKAAQTAAAAQFTDILKAIHALTEAQESKAKKRSKSADNESEQSKTPRGMSPERKNERERSRGKYRRSQSKPRTD